LHFYPRQCSTNNTVIMWMIILTITFFLVNKRLLDYACFTDKQLDILFEYQNMHISVSISSLSWCAFHTEALKHKLNFLQVHNFNEQPISANTTHTLGLELGNVIFASTPVPLPYRLVCERTWATDRSTAFTVVLPLEDSEKSLTLIRVFLQIWQTYWCLCLIRHLA
jgi:hypothetical protein